MSEKSLVKGIWELISYIGKLGIGIWFLISVVRYFIFHDHAVFEETVILGLLLAYNREII